ncbi:AMP-binding enzyme [Necator americanus]|uniref:AMP-binding enzyme n=1 Tax=Necator americanus TaxID=51031 RepID=W2TXE6_NECAM|nr:AMP-binding enzyme [Necator americanus]ETN86319.1 AMP-binding enzyme [Necator americanus]
MTGAVNPPLDREKDKLLLLLPFYHCYGFGEISRFYKELINYKTAKMAFTVNRKTLSVFKLFVYLIPISDYTLSFQGLLMDAVLNDFTSVHMSHFQPELFCQSIQKYGIRFLAVAPPILSFLARNPICERYDLSFLNTLLNGAAPLQKDVCDELVSKYKNIKHICQGYGMSEICMASHLPDLISGQPFGSVGKLASNMEMKIVDPETGIAKKRGELGEICIRGPTVMYGYFGKPEMTQKCIKDGWMYTGDIGYVDDDGYLFIVDRLKELIKVSPTELERILQAHPLISDAAVVGVPDSIKGELPKAFVIRKSDNLSAEEVKSFLKEKVSPYKQLSGGVEFVEEIPKLPSGKVLRRLLRERSKSK